jgi:hypothetical protein
MILAIMIRTREEQQIFYPQAEIAPFIFKKRKIKILK